MKQKLTQNQLSLYEDVTSLVSEAKNESLGMLKALRHQAISTSSNSRLNLLEEKVCDDYFGEYQMSQFWQLACCHIGYTLLSLSHKSMLVN